MICSLARSVSACAHVSGLRLVSPVKVHNALQLYALRQPIVVPLFPHRDAVRSAQSTDAQSVIPHPEDPGIRRRACEAHGRDFHRGRRESLTAVPSPMGEEQCAVRMGLLQEAELPRQSVAESREIRKIRIGTLDIDGCEVLPLMLSR